MIAILLILPICTSITLLPNAYAHTPPLQIPTYSFCSASPNPVSVGQSVNVNFWVDLPPPTANAQFGDRWQGITVKVTKPGGTTETLGPFISDATGGSHTAYTPNVVGNYTFQMFFGGQTLAGNNLLPGTSPYSYPNIGDYYQPSSSNVFTLTVQQQPIAYAPVTPLPTTYWTRPIYAENNNWYSIAGNWLGTGPSSFAYTGMYNETGNYNPYTSAPNTSHILWTKPEAFGGTMGGEFGGSETGNFYSTSEYEPKFAPIIMNGILYYTVYPGAFTNPAGWAAVNLQTGQTIWTKNTTEILRCGQILDYSTPDQYGGLAYLWSSPTTTTAFGYIYGAVGPSLEMWDAMTGNYILSITNITTGYLQLTTDDHGNLVGYYVNYTDNTLNMWNSTRCINEAVLNTYSGTSAPLANNWNWRPPQNAYIDFGLGIQWSAPLATEVSGSPLIDYENGLYGLYLYGVESGVVLLYEAAGVAGFQTGWNVEAGYSATDGSQLWIVNRTETPYAVQYGDSVESDTGVWMGNGAYVDLTEATLSITGYSLNTGQQLWGPTKLPNASPFSSLGAEAQIANGTIYIWLYGGDVYAYNILTGTLKWQYHTPSGGYESPYGVEPLWTFAVGTVADGKLFVPEGHQYSPPLFRQAQQLALNITNGQVVWSIDAYDVTSAPAISDGVMTTLNAYDNQIYAYGMGPSKTTVNAPDPVTYVGSPIVLSGSVTDISAGASQQAVAANFPNGLPCVSDTSMTQFMEAVYEQQPMPTNTTGVPVTLYVLDSNNNYRAIGTTTTDASGSFGFTWKPDIAGNYTVYATFAGTGSYYGSSAEAHIYASSLAATSAPTATPLTGLASNATVEYGIVAIAIIIIVIGAVLALLVTRKHA